MIRAGRFLVKEEHVGFDTLSVEDTGGQAQQRMHVTLLQQFAANSFTCSTLEEYVIRDNHSRPTMNLEQGFDMLDKVQLLVAGAGPEVVAHNYAGLALLASLFVDKSDAALTPKGGIGQHAINNMHWRLALFIAANAVQEEIHYAQASRIVHDLPTV